MRECLRYRYLFVTESSFLPAVGYHFFKLRAVPMETPCQHVCENALHITPECQLWGTQDGFGNSVQCGGFDTPHTAFRVASQGVVECTPYAIPDASPAEYYRYATPHTSWDEDIRHLGASDEPCAIMHAVHRSLVYERFVTDNTTTAQQALLLGKGVCQDFAHLMIAACRSAGLPARYANGLVLGEGETHAWVEVWHDGVWLGYDPTRDCRVGWGYVKLAHGRDVDDCPTNRGRFYGWTSELMTVNCKLEQL